MEPRPSLVGALLTGWVALRQRLARRRADQLFEHRPVDRALGGEGLEQQLAVGRVVGLRAVGGDGLLEHAALGLGRRFGLETAVLVPEAAGIEPPAERRVLSP